MNQHNHFVSKKKSPLPAQVQRELVCQGNVCGSLVDCRWSKTRQRFARGLFKHPKLNYLVISPLTANAKDDVVVGLMRGVNLFIYTY
jgi:hypothetical protein